MIVESVDRNQLIFNKVKFNIKLIKLRNPVRCRVLLSLPRLLREPTRYNDVLVYVIIGNVLFTINNLFLLIHKIISIPSSLGMIKSLSENNHV